MENTLAQIYQSLQKLMGLHRRLLDVVRLERTALTQADLKAIQEVILSKQGLIEAIQQAETERLKVTGELAFMWKKPLKNLTLPNIIIGVQGEDPKTAELLRGTYNALTVMIQRITEQNTDNRHLVEKSLEHVQHMKRNVLGERTPKQDSYNPHGQKSRGMGGSAMSRPIISKEA